jgi:hypothetical protein
MWAYYVNHIYLYFSLLETTHRWEPRPIDWGSRASGNSVSSQRQSYHLGGVLKISISINCPVIRHSSKSKADRKWHTTCNIYEPVGNQRFFVWYSSTWGCVECQNMNTTWRCVECQNAPPMCPQSVISLLEKKSASSLLICSTSTYTLLQSAHVISILWHNAAVAVDVLSLKKQWWKSLV